MAKSTIKAVKCHLIKLPFIGVVNVDKNQAFQTTDTRTGNFHQVILKPRQKSPLVFANESYEKRMTDAATKETGLKPVVFDYSRIGIMQKYCNEYKELLENSAQYFDGRDCLYIFIKQGKEVYKIKVNDDQECCHIWQAFEKFSKRKPKPYKYSKVEFIENDDQYGSDSLLDKE